MSRALTIWPRGDPPNGLAQSGKRQARDSGPQWAAARHSGEAFGVIEERPLPVVVDLHAPAQLGTACTGVGEPHVCGLRAVKILHRHSLAMWVDDPELGHAMWLSLPVGI